MCKVGFVRARYEDGASVARANFGQSDQYVDLITVKTLGVIAELAAAIAQVSTVMDADALSDSANVGERLVDE